MALLFGPGEPDNLFGRHVRLKGPLWIVKRRRGQPHPVGLTRLKGA